MRNISFALTTPQFIAGTKTVTRRNGWAFLKAGDRLMAVEKSMGLRKGEKIVKLGEIEVTRVTRERLDDILCSSILMGPVYSSRECAQEGFPNWTGQQFINFYCQHNGGDGQQMVTRIEFRKVLS